MEGHPSGKRGGRDIPMGSNPAAKVFFLALIFLEDFISERQYLRWFEGIPKNKKKNKKHKDHSISPWKVLRNRSLRRQRRFLVWNNLFPALTMMKKISMLFSVLNFSLLLRDASNQNRSATWSLYQDCLYKSQQILLFPLLIRRHHSRSFLFFS